MHSSKTRVALFQLFVHEIFAEARKRIAGGLDALEARNNLSEALDTQQKAVIAGAFLTIVVALLANGLVENELVVIRSAIGSVEFPAIYLIFFGCMGWFVFVISSLQTTVLLLAQASLNHLPHFSADRSSAYTVLTGGKNYDFLSPIRPGNFFTLRGEHILAALLYIPFLLLLLPMFGSIAAILGFLISAISTTDSVFLGLGFEIASLCLVIFPVAFSILFFLPFSTKKDVSFIRWTFLLRVTDTSKMHHNSEK